MTTVFVEAKSPRKPIIGRFEEALRIESRRKLYIEKQLPLKYTLEDYATIGHAAIGSWVRYLAPHINDNQQVVFVDDSNPDYAATFKDSIKEFPEKPIFLFSVVTQGFELTKELIRILREERKDAKTVVGGVHASLNPIYTMNEIRPDYLIQGEADHTIETMIDSLRKGIFPEIPGMYYFDKSELRHTNLDNTQAPIDSIKLDWSFHIKHSPGNTKYAPFYLSSRDCPFRCRFCSILPANKYRCLPSNQVVDDINKLRTELRDHGYVKRPLYVIFEDPTFMADKKQVYPLIEAIGEMGISWEVRTRIEKPTIQTKTLYQLMKQAGCRFAFFGIESFDQTVLDVINKRTKVDWIEPYLEAVCSSGILTSGGFIVGLPKQSYSQAVKDQDRACELIKSRVLTSAEYYFLNPYPGSEFYDHGEIYDVHIHNVPMSQIEHNIIHHTSLLSSKEILELYDHGCQRLAQTLNSQTDKISRKEQEIRP